MQKAKDIKDARDYFEMPDRVRPEIREFSRRMERKLIRESRSDTTNWKGLTPKDLIEQLQDSVAELRKSFEDECDDEKLLEISAKVGNNAMMFHDAITEEEWQCSLCRRRERGDILEVISYKVVSDGYQGYTGEVVLGSNQIPLLHLNNIRINKHFNVYFPSYKDYRDKSVYYYCPTHNFPGKVLQERITRVLEERAREMKQEEEERLRCL